MRASAIVATAILASAPGTAMAQSSAPSSSAARSDRLPSDSTFPWTITATPATLRLGVDRSARLEIHGPDLPPSALDLQATTGSIREIVRVGPGRYTARYEPPAVRAPDVALVTVRSTSEPTPAAVSIPLFGRYHLTVDVEPRAQVQIDLADGTSHSAVAPASGRIDAMLHVAPGIDRARVQATDRGGNVTERIEQIAGIPLHRLALFRAPPPVTQPRAARWFVIAADTSGALADVAPTGIQVTGALGVVTRRAPGVFEIRANPARRAEPTTIAIHVTQPGTALAIDHDEFVVAPNAPESLEWQGPERVRAGEEVAVRIVALDASREPVTGLADRLRVRAGGDEARAEAVGDAYRVVFRAPERAGDSEIFVRLAIDNRIPLELRRVMRVASNVPARIQVVTPPLQIGMPREVGFVPIDRFGNRATLEHPTASVIGGTVRGTYLRRGGLVLLIEPTDVSPQVHLEADYGFHENVALRAAPVPEGRVTLLAMGSVRTNFGAAVFGGGRLSATVRFPIDRAWDIGAMLDAGVEASDVRAASGDSVGLIAVPLVPRLGVSRRFGSVRLGIAAGGVLRIVNAAVHYVNAEGPSTVALVPGVAASALLRWFSPVGVIALDVGAESGWLDTSPVRGTLGGLQVSLGWGFAL